MNAISSMKKNLDSGNEEMKEGFQLKLDFKKKVEESRPSYDLKKHFQHFPREKRLAEHE